MHWTPTSLELDIAVLTYQFCGVSFTGTRSPFRYIICGDDNEALVLAKYVVKGSEHCEVWSKKELIGVVSSAFSSRTSQQSLASVADQVSYKGTVKAA